MEVLTTDEVAKLFRVKRLTVYRWIKKGLIQYSQIGKRYKFIKKNIEDLLEKGINEK